MGEARRDGEGNGRFVNRPFQMVFRGNEGWVPASARTRGGGGAMGEARRDGGGNGRFANRPFQMVFRGNEGMGPRIREDKGGRGSDG